MIAHGNVEFEWYGNILIYKLQGAFNEEGLISLIQSRQKYLDAKNVEQWLRVIYLHDDALMATELFKKAVEMEIKSKEEGCIDTIYVVPNEGLRRLRIHYESSFGHQSKYCDSIEDAIAVLSKRAEFILN